MLYTKDLIDILRTPQEIYDYVNTLREGLKPLSLDDETIKLGIKSINKDVPTLREQLFFNGLSLERRTLLVFDCVEDYQVIRVFVWDYDNGKDRLYETSQFWIYVQWEEGIKSGILDCVFHIPKLENDSEKYIWLGHKRYAFEKDMIPSPFKYYGDIGNVYDGDAVCPQGKLHTHLIKNGLTMELLTEMNGSIGTYYCLFRKASLTFRWQRNFDNMQAYFLYEMMEERLLWMKEEGGFISNYAIKKTILENDYVTLVCADKHNKKHISATFKKDDYSDMISRKIIKNSNKKTSYRLHDKDIDHWGG